MCYLFNRLFLPINDKFKNRKDTIYLDFCKTSPPISPWNITREQNIEMIIIAKLHATYFCRLVSVLFEYLAQIRYARYINLRRGKCI